MSIISLADRRSADTRCLVGGFAGGVPVDVLVESPSASKVARHVLQRLVHLMPAAPVLHEEAHLAAAHILDALIDELAVEQIPFVSVSVGCHLEATTSPAGTVVADPSDPWSVSPSLVVALTNGTATGISTAIAAPKDAHSLVSATVSSARLALSTVLARSVLVLGSLEASTLLASSKATGIAVSADGDIHPCL
jgi:hypothetical protein